MPALRRHLPPLLVFVALTVLLAFPVVASLVTGGVPGWEGDNLYYVRSMWWMKRALFELGISPFLDPTAFYPVGHFTARSELTVTNTLLGLPVTMVAGPVAAYNVMLLFSFVATAAGTYLWVEHLTAHRPAAVLAGTIVAFLPYRFAHQVGHLPQMTMQWIPLTLYAFERFVDLRTVGRAAFLGAMAAAVALGCWYYGYALAVMLPVYALLSTITAGRRALWRERKWWVGILVSAAVAVTLMLPLLVQMLRLTGEGALGRSLGEMESWSLNVYDLFLPNLAHPAWGELTSRWFPSQRALWVEKAHGLGYIALLLALVGLVRLRRQRLVAALAGTWLVGYAIALGPTLHFGDRQVRIPVPSALAGVAERVLRSDPQYTPALGAGFLEAGVPVPLPSFFMYRFVPYAKNMRVMARFSVWCALMTAALAAFGLIHLMAAAERRWGVAARRAVPAIAIALVAFESLSVQSTMPVVPRAVDAWLAAHQDEVVVVELPIAQALRAYQNYWATGHQRKSLFGWNGDSFPPPIQTERMAALADFPSPASVAYLQAVGATHLLTTPSQIPNWDSMERSLSESPLLRLEHTIEGVRVYRVRR